MGSRGGSSGMNGGSGRNVNVVDTVDVWSYRHETDNEPFVDAINEGARKIQDDFKDLMLTVERVDAAELGGIDKLMVLGYYAPDEKTVAINRNFTDIDKMNAMYDAAVRSGYHPPRGELSGTEAVTLHELGHALTDHVAKKMGESDMDVAARKLFERAYRATKGRGKYQAWAEQISGYAKENYAEAVAEAVADYYCNGQGAHANSRAIMRELRKYI